MLFSLSRSFVHHIVSHHLKTAKTQTFVKLIIPYFCMLKSENFLNNIIYQKTAPDRHSDQGLQIFFYLTCYICCSKQYLHFTHFVDYIRDLYNAMMSSSVGSFGFPGVQASLIADSAKNVTSSSFTISFRSAGIPTS